MPKLGGILTRDIAKNGISLVKARQVDIRKTLTETTIRMNTEEQGAQTTVYLAVSEEVNGVTGKYFSDCKEQPSSKKTNDADLALQFWEASVKVVNLKQ